MAPIVGLSGRGRVEDFHPEDYTKLMGEILEETIRTLKIPDPNDKEIRTMYSRYSDSGHVIYVEYGIGERVYAYLNDPTVSPRFYPTEEQRRDLALKIAKLKEQYGLQDANLVIAEWEDTVFEFISNMDPVTERGELEALLNEIGEYSITIFVNSQELAVSLENAIPNAQIICVEGSEAAIGVEFDTLRVIPLETKGLLAKNIGGLLKAQLDDNTPGAKASNVWIRSGMPKQYSY